MSTGLYPKVGSPVPVITIEKALVAEASVSAPIAKQIASRIADDQGFHDKYITVMRADDRYDFRSIIESEGCHEVGINQLQCSNGIFRAENVLHRLLVNPEDPNTNIPLPDFINELKRNAKILSIPLKNGEIDKIVKIVSNPDGTINQISHGSFYEMNLKRVLIHHFPHHDTDSLVQAVAVATDVSTKLGEPVKIETLQVEEISQNISSASLGASELTAYLKEYYYYLVLTEMHMGPLAARLRSEIGAMIILIRENPKDARTLHYVEMFVILYCKGAVDKIRLGAASVGLRDAIQKHIPLLRQSLFWFDKTMVLPAYLSRALLTLNVKQVIDPIIIAAEMDRKSMFSDVPRYIGLLRTIASTASSLRNSALSLANSSGLRGGIDPRVAMIAIIFLVSFASTLGLVVYLTSDEEESSSQREEGRNP